MDKETGMRGKLSKEQRLQIKGLICVLAVLLLLVLVGGKLFQGILHNDREQEEVQESEEVPGMPPEPVEEVLKNVWILKADSRQVTIFREGRQETYEVAADSGKVEGSSESDIEGKPESDTEGGPNATDRMPSENGKAGFSEIRDELGDVYLTDFKVTGIQKKTEKIHGRVLAFGRDFLELEEHGRVELEPDYRGYKLFAQPEMKTVWELAIGYDLADFVIEDGKVCGILFAREEVMKDIRVLIRSTGYEKLFHESLEIKANCLAQVQAVIDGVTQNWQVEAGNALVIDDSFWEENRVQGWITITPDLLTGKLFVQGLNRASKDAGYAGKFEIRRTDQGFVLINEVPLEEYLYAVVPSEMPSGYPKEALKAQAICARTYAYGRILRAGYPEYGAHLDDSTAYQVYHNIEEQASTNQAVKETYGLALITAQGETAETYYYSTSCGRGTDMNAWHPDEETAAALSYLQGEKISRERLQEVRQEYSGADENEIEGEPLHATRDTDEGEGNGWGDKRKENAGGSKGDKIGTETDLAEDESKKNTVQKLWWTNLLERDTEIQSSVLDMLLQEDMKSGTDKDLSREENALFLLDRDTEDFECGQSLYRWIYEVPVPDGKAVCEKLSGWLLEVPEFQTIQEIRVTKRGTGGIADEILFVTDAGEIYLTGERAIRDVLCDGQAMAICQDGKKISCPKLLPSAFFLLFSGTSKENVVGYTLIGGGYGHGIGMSQNAARMMAGEGYSAEEILGFFYRGTDLKSVY